MSFMCIKSLQYLLSHPKCHVPANKLNKYTFTYLFDKYLSPSTWQAPCEGLNIQKTKIMASDPITSWQMDGERVTDFFWGGGFQKHCRW